MAAEVCREAGLVLRHDDDFAPTSFSPAPAATEALKALAARFEVFANYRRQSDETTWLNEAIKVINDRWERGQFRDESEPDVWEPLPVERESETFQNAAAALDEAIEAVRADNGYAASHPEERRYVLDHLSALAKRLREDAQLSWMYLKEFGFKPLGMVIERFGKAATGIVAAGAREALVAWVKERGGELLHWLFK
jgi:hypothetical protein